MEGLLSRGPTPSSFFYYSQDTPQILCNTPSHSVEMLIYILNMLKKTIRPEHPNILALHITLEYYACVFKHVAFKLVYRYKIPPFGPHELQSTSSSKWFPLSYFKRKHCTQTHIIQP